MSWRDDYFVQCLIERRYNAALPSDDELWKAYLEGQRQRGLWQVAAIADAALCEVRKIAMTQLEYERLAWDVYRPSSFVQIEGV